MARDTGARRDMGLLLLTGALHLLFENVLHAKGPFLAAAGIVWLAWIVHRRREDPDLLHRWGVGSASGAASVETAAVTVPAAVGLLWIAPRLGHAVPAHTALLAALYLPWALVQEVALQGILLQGLETVLPPRMAVLAAGALFGAAHLPDPTLSALTFAMGAVWAVLFRRHRTVRPLAVSHATLGALTYLAILGRDPLTTLLTHL